VATEGAQSEAPGRICYLPIRVAEVDAMDPPDRLQALEEEYKFDQSGAGLTVADQPAEIRRSSSAASYVRSENSDPVQAIVRISLRARPQLSINGQTTRSTKVKRIVPPIT